MFKHRATMFLYFYVYVSTSFFFSPYLINEKGFAAEKMGYLTTIGLVLLICSFFISGYLADKIKSNRKIIITNLIISFFVVIGLVIFDNKLILSILYILSWSNFIMITSQLDGLVIRDIDPSKYSIVRAFGSYGAAVSYFVNSYALTGISTATNLLINALLIAITIILVFSIKETAYQNNGSIADYKREVNKAIKVKPILLIMIISFLTYGTLSADDSYQVIYNTDIVKISAAVMGIVGFISIVSEGSFMHLHKFIINRIGIINTLYTAIITLFLIYITRFTMYTSPAIINIGSILMGVFIGFYVPSAIMIINRFIQDDTKNMFLSLYQIMIRLGGVIIGFITAIFFDLTGTLQNIYLLHTIVIASSLIFVHMLKKHFDENNIEF